MSVGSTPLSLPASSSLLSVLSSANAVASTRASGNARKAFEFQTVRTAVSCRRLERRLDQEPNSTNKDQPGKNEFSSRLAARMVAAVQLFHALARHVRVDLRCRYVAVAEQQLHDPEVGAVVEQVR